MGVLPGVNNASRRSRSNKPTGPAAEGTVPKKMTKRSSSTRLNSAGIGHAVAGYAGERSGTSSSSNKTRPSSRQVNGAKRDGTNGSVVSAAMAKMELALKKKAEEEADSTPTGAAALLKQALALRQEDKRRLARAVMAKEAAEREIEATQLQIEARDSEIERLEDAIRRVESEDKVSEKQAALDALAHPEGGASVNVDNNSNDGADDNEHEDNRSSSSNNNNNKAESNNNKAATAPLKPKPPSSSRPAAANIGATIASLRAAASSKDGKPPMPLSASTIGGMAKSASSPLINGGDSDGDGFSQASMLALLNKPLPTVSLQAPLGETDHHSGKASPSRKSAQSSPARVARPKTPRQPEELVLLTNADEQGEFFPPELRIKHSNLFTPGNLADWQKAAVYSNGPLQLSGNLRTQTNKYELCLSKQNLGVADAYVLAKALATNTWVQKVDLSDNNLEDDGIVLICRALMLNPRIWSINLKNNNLSVRAAKAIAAVLRAPVVVPKSGLIWGGKMKGGGKGLEAMLLDGNDLGSLGTAALCSALKANPSNALTKLSLASSRVGTAGAEALGLLLMSNQCRVRELNVNGPRNDIGAAGAMALSCGLQNNTSLVALEVSRNNISSEGTIAFVDMLENHNKTIKSLSLAHNMVKDDAGARLFKVLLNQSEFNELSLVHCDVHANKFSLALQQEWKPLLEEKGNKLSSILQLTASESEKKAHRLKKAVEDAARDEEDRAIQLAAATNSAHGIGAGDKSARSRKKDDEKKIKSATHLEGIIRDVIKGKTGSNVFVQKGVEVNWGTVRLWNRRGGIHTSTESSASNFIR